MELKEITQLIRDLGFPIFVAAWLLLRVDKVLEHIKNHMTREEGLLVGLRESIDKLHERL